MKRVDELFEAVASTPLELALLHNDAMGFLIPEYQREYDWSTTNINRLYNDILNGFCRVPFSNDASVYTFLGSIILVRQGSAEKEFTGVSLEVIDGQQRLTTLTFIACAICELLRKYQFNTDFSTTKRQTKEWLHDEIQHWLASMHTCAVGSQRVGPRKTYPFSRIIRDGDIRGTDYHNAEYQSSIGRLLYGFSIYFESEELAFELPELGDTEADKKIESNYKEIRRILGRINDIEWYEDTECEIFDINWISRAQCPQLFHRLGSHFPSEDKQNQTLSELQHREEIHDITRLIMFASYFCNCITLTRVITEDESSAFDIFDALNTTGQPLTALETLKPRIIRYEREHGEFSGSSSDIAFDEVVNNIDVICGNRGTSKKQSETKELVVSFALYLCGEKISKDLAQQRLFLRNKFKIASESSKDSRQSVDNFLDSLRVMSKFRRYYWTTSELDKVNLFHGQDTVDDVKLLSKFIIDIGSSLTLPVLSRYWSTNLATHGDGDFLTVLRSLVAFIVLWRGAMGGTSGIDSEFRKIMSESDKGYSIGLCKGIGGNNVLIKPHALQEKLREMLTRKIDDLEKNSWVNKVCANPLYQHSRVLVRFMILAAAHKAIPSVKEPGLLARGEHIPSEEQGNLLSYKTWMHERYSTVEHIAPQANNGNWLGELYKDEILRHSIGNLVLLPPSENSAIGLSDWDNKHLIYLALSESNPSVVKDRIEQAESVGFTFTKSIRSSLEKGSRLSLLDSLRDVGKWNEDIVIRRGQNISGLCWDVIRPWLGE